MRPERPPTSSEPPPSDVAPTGALGAHLERWVQADLLSTVQAEKILAFEAQRSSAQRTGRVARAIALLGALTVISGIGSLIAYNWGKFGPTTKLLGMALLLIGSIAYAWRAASHRRDSPTGLEVALLIHAGLCLTGLALVSQIYAQDGELWQLLAVWCALTAPALFLTRSRFANAFWFAGLFGTLCTAIEDLDDLVENVVRMPHDLQDVAVVTIVGGATAIVAARFAASRHAERASVGRAVLQLGLLSLGALGGLLWFHGANSAPLLFGFVAAWGAAIIYALPPSVDRLGWGSRRDFSMLLGVGIGGFALPTLFSVDSGIAAFLAYVAFFSAAWFFAERAGSDKNVRLAVLALAIRIVIASFELFENLLVTGTVLVGCGVGALLWSRHKWAREGKEGSPA